MLVCIAHVNTQQCWKGSKAEIQIQWELLLADSSLMETHLSLVSWIYIVHAHTHTHMHKTTHVCTHSDRAQLMGQDSQHSSSKALFNLSSHEVDWDGNISFVSTIPVSPDTSVYSLSSVRYRQLSSRRLPFFLCVSVRTEWGLFCAIYTLCLISVCLPSLALFSLLETSWSSDPKPLSDLTDCGGSQRARLCVSLSHLVNRAGRDANEKSSADESNGINHILGKDLRMNNKSFDV